MRVTGKLIGLIERGEDFFADGFGLVAASWAFSLRSSSMTTNSSPPSRATVSPSRTHAARRWATCCSSRSPMSWPRVSLRVLKLSRSMNSSAPCRCAGAGSDRLVQPVDQQAAVGQTGQRIEEGQLLDSLFRLLALGDVATRAIRRVSWPMRDKRRFTSTQNSSPRVFRACHSKVCGPSSMAFFKCARASAAE